METGVERSTQRRVMQDEYPRWPGGVQKLRSLGLGSLAEAHNRREQDMSGFSVVLNRDEALEAIFAAVRDEVRTAAFPTSTDVLGRVVSEFTSGTVFRLVNSEAGLEALREVGFTRSTETEEVEIDEDVIRKAIADQGFTISDLGLEDEAVEYALDNESEEIIERLRSNGDIPDVDEAASALADASDAIRNAESALGV